MVIHVGLGQPLTARSYYSEYLKHFGKASLEAWRKEISAAVVTTGIAWWLTRHNPDALENAVSIIEANLIWFSFFVIWYLVRTPLHLHQLHYERAGSRPISAFYAVIGVFLLVVMVGGILFSIIKPRLDPAIRFGFGAPAIPIDRVVNQAQPTTRPVGHEIPKSAPAGAPGNVTQQPPPAAVSQPALATQLDRVIQTDRNLTPDDRNRLSSDVYEYSQILDNGTTLGGKVYTEFGKINQDLQSTALVTTVDDHIATLRAIIPLANSYYRNLEQAITKGQYFQDQTNYIFGDNPFNLGPNSVINATQALADFLSNWSRASNRKEMLTLVPTGQNDAAQYMQHYSQWIQGCRQRLEQVKQSLQPNGVVQPIPSGTVAPATGMFTMKHD